MAEEDEKQVLRREFHLFWKAGLRGHDYLSDTAIVCFLDLDQEEVTVTRVFYSSAEGGGGNRAEDHMIDWLYEDQLVQKADSVDMKIFMNYSPLKLTVDGLIAVFNNLKDTGKEVKVMLKFVQLYMTSDGEADAAENREGLRQLVKYGAELDIMRGRDWQFLMQTLTRRAGKKQQAETGTRERTTLREILRNPRDVDTNTETPEACEAESETDPPPEACEAETMTDRAPTPPPPPPPKADESSSSSSDEE